MNKTYTDAFVCLKIVILLLSVILPVQGSWSARRMNYHAVNYSVKDGLSQNSVLSIAMDSRNMLWVGTRIGLNSYNGKEFVHVTSQEYPEFNSAEIMQMSVDADDVVWCYSKSRIFSYSFKDEELKRYDGKFTSVFAATDGNVYATRADSMIILDKNTGKFGHLLRMKGWGRLMESSDRFLYAVNDEYVVRYAFSDKEVTYFAFPDGRFSKEKMQLYSDRAGRLWISNYKGGVYVINSGADSITKWDDENLSSFIGNQPSRMAGDNNYLYFTSVYYGVVVYSPETKSIVARMFNAVGYPSSISHNNISSVFYDKRDGLWIGSFAGGLDYVNLSAGGLSSYKVVKNMPNALGTVGQFAEFDDRIYTGTEGGLVRIDKATGLAEYEHIDLPQLRGLGFKCISRFGDDKLIIAPYMRGIHVYDINRKRVVASINDIPFADIKVIYCEDTKRVWLAALQGMGYIDTQTNKVHTIEGLPEGVLINSIGVAPDGNIYICTRRNGLLRYDRKNEKVESFTDGSADWLKERYITSVMWDNRKRMWISTYEGGVYRCEIAEGRKYPYVKEVMKYTRMDNNLVNDYVVGTVEDGNNSVWCVTLDGVSRISAQGIVKNFSAKTGWGFIEPTVGGLMIDSSQQVWIGANNGIFTFPAMEIRNNLFVPEMEFCKVRINGNKEEEKRINRAIRDKGRNSFKMEIDYDSFPLYIEFNAINYSNHANNKYRYRIVQMGNEWIDLGNNSTLNIAGLSPGRYDLQVMGANNDAMWNETPIQMQISVEPPLWQTWWAYMIYVLLLVGAFLNYIRKVKLRQQRKHELMLEKELRKNQEKLNEEKLQFYTNFSHEMRTPLTLIMGPIEELAGKVEDKKQARILNMAKDNCKRLMYLVNQLLDFRKMEDGSLSLHYTERTPAVMVKKVCDTFMSSAGKRHIGLRMELDENMRVKYDSFLIETVVFNLLSNAFKFTPDNGEVRVGLECVAFGDIPQKYAARFKEEYMPEERMMRLSVKDTGQGVPQAEADKIFARFYQMDSNGALVRGSGLGLNFCQEIALQHKGIIYVESKEGEGAEFVFIIPCSADVAIQAEDTADETTPEDVPYVEEAAEENAVKAEGKLRILFVEDNCDISDFVADGLEDTYVVDTAADGVEALEKMKANEYSVVISDVMMPKMNGLELCRHIKNNLETSHIPVILLTARTADEHKMEGYDSHADDYICKPFSMSLLKAAIRNVLWKMARYGNMVTMDTKDMAITNAQTLDEKFMNAFYKFIDDNISDAELNNDVISRELGIGRTQLNSKIKALTMSTPAKLVYKRRLYRAKLMMDQGAGFVSDIAYDCGFSDPIYFSRCFKKEYGVSPTDYIKKQEEK